MIEFKNSILKLKIKIKYYKKYEPEIKYRKKHELYIKRFQTKLDNTKNQLKSIRKETMKNYGYNKKSYEKDKKYDKNNDDRNNDNNDDKNNDNNDDKNNDNNDDKNNDNNDDKNNDDKNDKCKFENCNRIATYRKSKVGNCHLKDTKYEYCSYHRPKNSINKKFPYKSILNKVNIPLHYFNHTNENILNN